MRPDDLLTWLRAAPFRPFRIVLNSGRTYEIRHPETVRLTYGAAHIYFPNGGDAGAADAADVYERVEMVGLALMERVEPLETKTKGKRRK